MNIEKNVQPQVIGHPAGLFVLFFTEMWERFSYYGMRALFVLFLVSDIAAGGWAWPREEALKLYALYTGLVYVTPIFGGILADKVFGHRLAVLIGAILMTLGHGSMALETELTFYIGLGLLILGNGMFKPNISTIVGGLYVNNEDKKDAAYTIFYMGINAGAFLGILLCGYIGENVGWSYGFGLAGVFMLLGMLQFWFGQGIFGNIGLKPKKTTEHLPNDPIETLDAEETGQDDVKAIQKTEEIELSPKVIKDRLIVIGILAFFTIFFWMAFEQAGGSMSIFAKDYTNRVLESGAAQTFKLVNTIITVVPLLIISWVVVLLSKAIVKKYPLSTLFITISFIGIWIIAVWMLKKEYSSETAEVPASWFGVLNSLFIILFAPVFSKLWETRFNPTGAVKFAMGLILLGVGFAVLAYGSKDIPLGAKTAQVSMIWLILAYLFHTFGELCLSPVGLSYVSKLAPPKFVGLMFGVWFGATAIANSLAGLSGSFIDKISEEFGLSTFFLIYFFIPAAAGVILILLTPFIKKKMHGIH
jgi:POT family proton-dependent oligopeptide transporter